VAARSFARIHEANLKKQGILALTFEAPGDYHMIEMDDRMSFWNLEALTPGRPVRATIRKKSGASMELFLNHTFTEDQIEWFRAGSALNAFTRKKEPK